MNNLFLMHTQYNLILAAGVALHHNQTRNVLVLYAEFKVDKAMVDVLESIFDSVVVVNAEFYPPQRFLQEIKHIKKCLKIAESICNERFDNVYLSQERVFDLALLGRVKKNNRALTCIAIEEDAYYSIDNRMNAENAMLEISRREKFKNLLRRIMLIGFPYDHREVVHCYGMSKVYNSARLLFPSLARNEMREKTLIEVTNAELTVGIRKIYGDKIVHYPESEKYLLIFMDLFDRYNDQQRVKQVLKEIVSCCSMCGRQVLLKYHPRETERLTTVTKMHEIEGTLPAEKILLDLKEKDTIVLGNATTACRVAAKLGYRVYSICKIDAPENEKMHEFMRKIGVQCITSSQEIKEL